MSSSVRLRAGRPGPRLGRRLGPPPPRAPTPTRSRRRGTRTAPEPPRPRLPWPPKATGPTADRRPRHRTCSFRPTSATMRWEESLPQLLVGTLARSPSTTTSSVLRRPSHETYGNAASTGTGAWRWALRRRPRLFGQRATAIGSAPPHDMGQAVVSNSLHLIKETVRPGRTAATTCLLGHASNVRLCHGVGRAIR